VNKRRREILDALTPAVHFAMQVRDKGKSPALDDALKIPGLAMTARASADAPAEIMIYGRIGGGGWFDEGITGSSVAALLKEIGPGPLNVRINSGGGDVFDGVAIHSLLARHNGVVTTYVDGLAASAASFIMLAGDRIVSARNAFIMIHDAMTGTYGNGDTHRAAGELLDKVSGNIADMYAERAGEDAEHWRALMTVNGEDGTWYTGQEAMDAGLVDEITAVADESDEENAQAVGSRSVAALLAGWQAVLPEKIAASINFPADNVDETISKDDVSRETPAPVVDVAALKTSMNEILKGVFA
jgi:ATP-dependent protease ClpP protease subunit